MKKLKHMHPVKRWNRLSDTNRLFVTLAVLVVSVGGLIGWAQYQDWRNEQLLRDVSADFAQLEKDLEAELGVDVENKSGCFTTQEKFGDGKTGCFFRVEILREETDLREIVVAKIMDFGLRVSENSDRYFTFSYGEASCHNAYNKSRNYSFSSVECPVPIRAGNSSLIDELF